MLAGITFSSGSVSTADVIWLDRDGAVRDDPAWVEARLVEAIAAGRGTTVGQARVQDFTAMLGAEVRHRLRERATEAWRHGPWQVEVRRLLARLRKLAVQAVARRDRGLLALIERAISLAGGGLRAGEALELATLTGLPDAQLIPALARLPPPRPPLLPPVPNVAGLIDFVGDGG
jgi:hypothetical protein